MQRISAQRLSDRIFTVDGHVLKILHRPAERLNAILKTIKSAQKSVRLVCYMFHADQSGSEVLAALIDAAKRGVAVILVVDSFGSSVTQPSFFDPLVKAGGVFDYFGTRWGLGYFVRNHQKLLIVDDEVAVIGGFNITDQYFGRAGDSSWEDFGALIEGTGITELSSYFDKMAALSVDGHVQLAKLRNLVRRWPLSNGKLQWLLGGPTNRISPWARAFKRDLEQAKRADMVVAYFSPSQTILRRIARVSSRGGSIRLVMAGKSDNGATMGAARILYRYLLDRGAQILEYQTRPLHMKLMVIDDICYIGSANLDVRSLFINIEIMLRIEDAGLAVELRKVIDKLATASEVQSATLLDARGGWFTRLKWTLAYFLVNSVDFTIGRRIKLSLLKRKKT
jgi:cardiolipin synthase A/B